jgi:lipopolysaccharide transport system ATP-binding protein
MSPEIAIRTSGLGKRYRLGVDRGLSRNFRERLMELPRDLGRWFGRAAASSEGAPRKTDPSFWALRDLDLEVSRGEVLGIIGRNGAGKSTLLKLLSRITSPTTGQAEIHGRVGSLLEVGTGFHPELSGRDNVYLNGAILGMRRHEIEEKFEEIVAFSEIGRFIDTPVKRYSSGMRVRLGFAVAAFLDPEILFVDEVLAVGDAGFRKKCLGKMGNIAQAGRTIIFVSHNMSAIASLCSRVLIIDEGRFIDIGEPRAMIAQYLDRIGDEAQRSSAGLFDLRERSNGYGERDLIVRQVEVLDREYVRRERFFMGDPLVFRVQVQGLSAHPNSTIGITIKDAEDQWLASLNSDMSCRGVKEPRSDAETATLELERMPLLPGTYHIAVSITAGPHGAAQRIDYVERAGSFEVCEADVYGNGFPMEAKHGVVFLEGGWSIEGRE